MPLWQRAPTPSAPPPKCDALKKPPLPFHLPIKPVKLFFLYLFLSSFSPPHPPTPMSQRCSTVEKMSPALRFPTSPPPSPPPPALGRCSGCWRIQTGPCIMLVCPAGSQGVPRGPSAVPSPRNQPSPSPAPSGIAPGAAALFLGFKGFLPLSLCPAQGAARGWGSPDESHGCLIPWHSRAAVGRARGTGVLGVLLGLLLRALQREGL